MNTARRVPARVVLLAALLLLTAVAPASGAIVINEVESQPVDWVELKNTGAAPVDIGGYVIKDSQDDNAFTVPGGTSIAAGGYYVADALGFGLSNPDAARLFDSAAVLLDSHAWTPHASTTYGRCADGTGPFVTTVSVTQGAANDCPVPAPAWPGAAAVSIADGDNVFGSNLSGLVYLPSGSAARGVLWAVFNNPGTLHRLVHDGAKWAPDAAGGWGAGKSLRYVDGGGNPDAEGVTLADGDPTGIYVATERDGDGASHPAVLRYDVSSPGGTLVATREWDLTADLPGLEDNGGLEAITWIPDSVLVAGGLLDESTGAAYDPAVHAGHGSGLFFVGVEQTGEIVAYALGQAGGSTRVATIPSGFPAIQALEFEAETGRLWAVCDDTCNGRSKTLGIAQSGASDGRYVVSGTYERPAGMANLNNEGFALAPRAECVDSLKPALWTDDGNTGGHALREGRLGCTNPVTTTGDKTDTPVATTTATPPPAAVVALPPSVLPPPRAVADRTRPLLSKLRASRRQVAFTLSETSRVRVTIERRSGKRYKRVKAFTVRTRAGARTIRFKGRVAASKLRRGRLRITLVATDAAGNRSRPARRLVPS